MSTYLDLGIWWLIFFSAHSVMASTFLKNIINSLHPIFKSYYRLSFNIVSTLLLFPVIYFYIHLPSENLIVASIVYEIAGSTLVIFGVYVLVVGFKNYRTDEFIGTYQIKNHHEFHPSKLSRNGWNGVVRHPLYFGGIVLITGLFLASPTIKLGLTSAMVLGYLYVGTIWEEKKLKREFGQTYAAYQREVSMLVPIKWLVGKFR